MILENAALILLIWNIAVMLIYGLDKLKAKKGAWRIPEKTLLLLALFLGAPGALIGMELFRHKTKHRLFTIGVPVCFLLNVLTVYGIVFLLNKS